MEEGNKWPYSSLHRKEIQYKLISFSFSLSRSRVADVGTPFSTSKRFCFLSVYCLFFLVVQMRELDECVNSRTFPGMTSLLRYLFMRAPAVESLINRQIADNGLIRSAATSQLIEKKGERERERKKWMDLSLTHEWHNWVVDLFDRTITQHEISFERERYSKRVSVAIKRLLMNGKHWSPSIDSTDRSRQSLRKIDRLSYLS